MIVKMRTTITTKGFKMNAKEGEKMTVCIEKLTHALSAFKEDLPLLTFILKKDKKVGSPVKVKSPFYHEGTMTLRLPKKSLIAHVSNITAFEAIEAAFLRITKELQKYKGKHFKGHSKYVNKDSIKTLGEAE
jgi:ribosome-associated translation inhibitor RaiA